MVRKLLQVEGLSLNCRDILGWTALHWAVWRDHTSCVQLLGDTAGLDWNLQDEDGFSAVSVAVHCGRTDSLQLLLAAPHHQVDLAVLDSGGNSLVSLALENTGKGDPLKCLQLLCQEERLELNSRDEAGDTPLIHCLKAAKMEMAKIIL